MAGSPLSVFDDFIATTGRAILTDKRDVVLDTSLNTYIMRRFMSGQGMQDMLQGGETIRDSIILDSKRTYKHINVNTELSYTNEQIITNWSVDWRFTSAFYTYALQEVGLNTGNLNRRARHHQFKELRRTKEQGLYEDINRGHEEDLFETPNNANMEASEGLEPYSIHVFINEFANTVPPGFTTIQGINPVTKPKWRNQTATYAQLPAVGWDLFEAFSELWYKVRFEQLPVRPELSDPSSSPNVILASLKGMTNYEAGLRLNQDQFVTVGRQDPAYDKPMFRGIPLDYARQMDFTLAYDDGASGFAAEETGSLDEDGGDTLANPNFSGPRYLFVNGLYMKPVWNVNRIWEQTGPFFPSKQPFTRVVVVDSWHNFICRSRRRQGIVSPSATLV